MYSDLKGKVAVITGGTTGIGKMVARKLLEAGASVVIAGRTEATGREALAELQEQTGGNVTFVSCDVGVEEDVIRLVNAAVETYGGLDLALNNAGIGPDGIRIPFGPLTDLAEEHFDAQVQTNLRGTFLCLKYELTQMKAQGHGGSIVNISSGGGLRMVPNFGAYGPTKAAINALTTLAAVENGRFGIRVNVVCPGPTTGTVLMDNNMRSKMEQGLPLPGSQTPLGHAGTTEDIANAVLYLMSDLAKQVTGVALPVDGGMTCL